MATTYSALLSAGIPLLEVRAWKKVSCLLDEANICASPLRPATASERHARNARFLADYRNHGFRAAEAASWLAPTHWVAAPASAKVLRAAGRSHDDHHTIRAVFNRSTRPGAGLWDWLEAPLPTDVVLAYLNAGVRLGETPAWEERRHGDADGWARTMELMAGFLADAPVGAR